MSGCRYLPQRVMGLLADFTGEPVTLCLGDTPSATAILLAVTWN
jgi:hypothetical protein